MGRRLTTLNSIGRSHTAINTSVNGQSFRTRATNEW